MDYEDEIEDEDMIVECPMCAAPNAPMGQLGSRMHYSCRDCGMGYSHVED